MTAATLTLAAFVEARVQADAEPSWELLPYDCPPGCCAPAGWVGMRCLICGDTSFGGTRAAMEESAADHAETMHERERTLREVAAHRKMLHFAVGTAEIARLRGVEDEVGLYLLRDLASIWADHPDYAGVTG